MNAALKKVAALLADLRVRLSFIKWRADTWLQESRVGFDRRFGTDTTGYLSAEALGLDPDLASAYSPAPVPWTLEILRSLPLDPREYAFVDLGSGKGRVLLLASELGYRRVIGVELSPELHAVAQRNLDAWRRSHPRATAIELRLGDAADITAPDDGKTLFFLFNPFGPAVLDRVLERLVAAAEGLTAEQVLLYAWPVHAERFVRPAITPIGKTASWHLYRIAR
jgi:SAM-dependent methyltransferase